jgi:hypothetical protein
MAQIASLGKQTIYGTILCPTFTNQWKYHEVTHIMADFLVVTLKKKETGRISFIFYLAQYIQIISISICNQ